MSGPGDGRNKTESRCQRQPTCERKPVIRQTSRQNHGQHESNFKDPSELSVVHHGQQHLACDRFAERKTAHGPRFQQYPDRCGRRRDGETNPCETADLRPHGWRQGFSRTQSGLGHHRLEQDGPGCHRRGSKMYRANYNQWVDHTIPGHAIGSPSAIARPER
jgi:hypothetical protein